VDVKEAVAKAKDYTAGLFAQEQLFDLALEEVEYNEPSNEWLVTLGFSGHGTSPTSRLRVYPRPGCHDPIKSFEFRTVRDAWFP
jgi:hypothetical protein